jgi:ATP-dependent DNA helicase RecG
MEVGTKPVAGRRQVAGEVTPEAAPEVTGEVTPEVKRLLPLCATPKTRRELQAALRLKDDDHFRVAYVLPALHGGFIEMTIRDKPTSSKQRYRLTEKGRAWLRSRRGQTLNDDGTAGRVGP